jgi:hypothetical protein
MNDGNFMVSEFSNTVKKYIKKDLTQEVYSIVNIDTNIDDMKLNSTLLMKSKNSKITSNDIAVDLVKNSINSKVNLKFYKLNIDIKVSEKLDNPKVEYDLSNLLKSQVKDKLKSKLKDKVGSFLNKLF